MVDTSRFVHTEVTSGATTILSSGLNSLGVGSGVFASGINNGTTRDMMLKSDVTLGSSDLSSQPSPGIVLRLVESIDNGSSYEDSDDTCWGIKLPVAATSAAHKRIGDMYIPPGTYGIFLVNETGVTFPASGNTLKIKNYTPVATDV